MYKEDDKMFASMDISGDVSFYLFIDMGEDADRKGKARIITMDHY